MSNTERPSRTNAALSCLRAPSAWQCELGRRVAQALESLLLAMPPSLDHEQPASGAAAEDLPSSAWTVAAASTHPGVSALAGQGARARLYAQCLAHYRQQLRPQDETADDAGAALACFLAAGLQAADGEALTPQRWRFVLGWLERDVMPGLAWEAAALAERQEFFERMAILATAVGEWTVQASRQGPVAVASARAMAKLHLREELGLDDASLRKGLHWLLACRAEPAPRIAGDPDWDDTELPTLPTRQAGGAGL